MARPSDDAERSSGRVAAGDDRPTPDRHAVRRRRMVERDIIEGGIRDKRVILAMDRVRRERFVPPDLVDEAYENRPLPIGAGQTISQPLIVAAMAEAAEIEPGDRILEIGTGSGYGAAILARLGEEVWTIERHGSLAESARRHLEGEGFDNVTVIEGDGTLGWPPAAPFDAIVVTAGGPEIPAPLIEQLADGGRLIMPVGRRHGLQSLVRVQRTGDEITETRLGAVRFVPLIAGR